MNALHARRRVLAALTGAALLPWVSRVSAHPPVLEWGDPVRGDLFALLASPVRDEAALAAVARDVLVPALQARPSARVWSHAPLTQQYWLELAPERLQHYRVDAQTVLAALGVALGVPARPMPGRHALTAWSFEGLPAGAGRTLRDVDFLVAPGQTVSLSDLGLARFASEPPAWAGQAQLMMAIELEPEADRARALGLYGDIVHGIGARLPADVQVQVGRTGAFLAPLDVLYVHLGDAAGA